MGLDTKREEKQPNKIMSKRVHNPTTILLFSHGAKCLPAFHRTQAGRNTLITDHNAQFQTG